VPLVLVIGGVLLDNLGSLEVFANSFLLLQNCLCIEVSIVQPAHFFEIEDRLEHGFPRGDVGIVCESATIALEEAVLDIGDAARYSWLESDAFTSCESFPILSSWGCDDLITAIPWDEPSTSHSMDIAEFVEDTCIDADNSAHCVYDVEDL
jgi:hypothetical protein